MVQLSRTVRFCINDPADPSEGLGADLGRQEGVARGQNRFSSWPPMRGLGRYYEMRVLCAGPVDEKTGYLVNITQIDRAVQEHAVRYLEGLVAGGAEASKIGMGGVLRGLMGRLQGPLDGRVVGVRLDLTPSYNLAISDTDMESVILRQQYEFAAAHRLHSDRLSDEENRRVFGKCNNPSGHGHNYRLEAAVRAPMTADGAVLPPEVLDALVDEAVIQKLDHKHLNVDVPEFADLNPSVENIAKVIYGLLVDRVGEAGVELIEVNVWETGKTVCTYCGPDG